jgi:hypothetical protein
MARAATIQKSAMSASTRRAASSRSRSRGSPPPKSKEATRICQEDLNEVITAFVQDKTTIEQGLFNEELVPEELTQVRMGKIIKDKYPELDDGRSGGGAPARQSPP